MCVCVCVSVRAHRCPKIPATGEGAVTNYSLLPPPPLPAPDVCGGGSVYVFLGVSGRPNHRE